MGCPGAVRRRVKHGEPWQSLTLPCSNQPGRCGQHEVVPQHKQGSAEQVLAFHLDKMESHLQPQHMGLCWCLMWLLRTGRGTSVLRQPFLNGHAHFILCTCKYSCRSACIPDLTLTHCPLGEKKKGQQTALQVSCRRWLCRASDELDAGCSQESCMTFNIWVYTKAN